MLLKYSNNLISVVHQHRKALANIKSISKVKLSRRKSQDKQGHLICKGSQIQAAPHRIESDSQTDGVG